MDAILKKLKRGKKEEVLGRALQFFVNRPYQTICHFLMLPQAARQNYSQSKQKVGIGGLTFCRRGDTIRSIIME
jgi:hypothetical protein